MYYPLLFTVFALSIGSCKITSDDDQTFPGSLPELSIRDSWVSEQSGQAGMQFEVVAFGTIELPISFTYAVTGITADPSADFIAGEGSSVIGIGGRSVILSVTVPDDDLNEVDEKLLVTITGVTNATISDGEGIGIIRDNDDPTTFDDDGYFTPGEYYGYQLAWQDEFDGTELDLNSYNYDLNDGCPNLCGWGNNELQWYTDKTENVAVTDGKLIITATQEGPQSFKSGRIHTKGKRTFQFGRIDVRARLPIGQGIWPAIWALGSNIDDVGWPAAGEIDIMEMVGHRPRNVVGTAHWGQAGSGSTSKSSEFILDEDSIDKFHVFSIVWERDEIVWYVDETVYHIITPADMQGQQYRFNNPFFLLFNIAVGGNWPGSPDETTVFPQRMEIDYIRVFQ